MATANKATLQALFEQGDLPSGTNYNDLIDSCVNVAETSAQTLLSPLTATEFIAPRVSATNVNITGTFSAASMFGSSLTLTAGVSAGANINTTGMVIGSAMRVTGDVSASTGTVYASAMRPANGVLHPVVTISAGGSTQAAATLLSGIVNIAAGVSAGQKTGFTPRANRAGLVQYLYNNGPSANLWPPTGGTINGLAANAAFALATSAAYTIIHLTASSYGVHG